MSVPPNDRGGRATSREVIGPTVAAVVRGQVRSTAAPRLRSATGSLVFPENAAGKNMARIPSATYPLGPRVEAWRSGRWWRTRGHAAPRPRP